MHRWQHLSPRLQWLCRFAAAWLLVGWVFTCNAWSTTSMAWFHSHQFNSDDLVWGSLHRIADDPPVGLWRPNLQPHCRIDVETLRPHTLFPASPYEAAWLYAPDCLLPSSEAYVSQLGLQGRAVAAIGQALLQGLSALPRPGGRPETVVYYTLQAVRALQGLASAAVVALLLAWMGAAMGDGAWLVATASVMWSPWLVVFARSVYWQLPLMLLPCVVSTYVQWAAQGARWRGAILAVGWLLVALCVALKCATGYEYCTTVMLACLVPAVFYSHQARWWPQALAGMLLCTVALAAVLAWHGAALGRGDVQAGLHAVWERAAARTYPGAWDSSLQGGADAQLARQGSALGNLMQYLFGARAYSDVFMPFAVWLALFAWVAWHDPQRRTALTVLAVSVQAPVSWFVLAKGHSAVHTHLNYLLWHIPTMFWGWAYVGRRLQALMQRQRGASVLSQETAAGAVSVQR